MKSESPISLIMQGIKVCGASAEAGKALNLIRISVVVEVAMILTEKVVGVGVEEAIDIPGQTAVLHLMETAVVVGSATAVATEATVVEATEGIALELVMQATEDERVSLGISIPRFCSGRGCSSHFV